MSEDSGGSGDSGDSVSDDQELTDWERRRRRARVFGDTLPETTSDEREQPDPDRESAGDRWLREQVPPHHGS